MSSPTQWSWVWVNSRSWWWTGRPGVLQFTGSQRVRHSWVTELNWTELNRMEQGAMVGEQDGPGVKPRFKSQTPELPYAKSWANYLTINYFKDFPDDTTVKNPPAVQEKQVRPLGQEDPPEEGMATHSSVLAWRIPQTEEPGELQSLGLQSQTWLKWLSMHAQSHWSCGAGFHLFIQQILMECQQRARQGWN